MRPSRDHRTLLKGHRTRPVTTRLKHREHSKLRNHRMMATGHWTSVRCLRACQAEPPDAPHRTHSGHCSSVRWLLTSRLTTPDALQERPVHLWPIFQLRTSLDFHPTKFQPQKDSNKHELELVWVTSLKPSNFHKYLSLGIVVFMKIFKWKNQGASCGHKARGLNQDELWMLPLSMDEHSGCSKHNQKGTINQQACIWYEVQCNTLK